MNEKIEKEVSEVHFQRHKTKLRLFWFYCFRYSDITNKALTAQSKQ